MPSLLFRVDTTVRNATAVQLHEQLKYENRLSWDANVVAPAYIKEYADSTGWSAELVAYCTRPAAMGLIG